LAAAYAVRAGFGPAVELAIAGRFVVRPAAQAVAAKARTEILRAATRIFAALQAWVAVSANGPGTILGAVTNVFTEIASLIAAESTRARLTGTHPAFFDQAQGIAPVSVGKIFVVTVFDACPNHAVAALGPLSQCQSKRDELFGYQ
jgi:hypothetical protein